jgi:hypothetical protein
MDHPRPQLPTRQAFSEAVDSSFGIRVGEDAEPVEFTLIECKSLLSTDRQECYSLMFRGPSEYPPIQNTYFLENEQLGKLQLLLVPVGQDEQGLYLEAVMNHLLSR